jgi:hypothetical protein
LENNENLLLSEEIHFVETSCQILEINIKEKVVLIVATAMDGRNPSWTIKEIRSLLEALRAEAEVHRRRQAPYQTTQNVEGLDANTHSLEDLEEGSECMAAEIHGPEPEEGPYSQCM